MTNQKYIEEIIKVAREGDYKPRGIEFGISTGGWVSFESMLNLVPKEEMLLDPNFFRAIGKVKGWDKKMFCAVCGNGIGRDCDEAFMEGWQHYWHTFIDKIAEKDLDHAIEWLYNLIKE